MKKDLQPNKYISPVEHRKWKIMGHLLEESDDIITERKQNGVFIFWKRFAKRFLALFGLFILLTIIVMAIVVPFFASDPRQTDVNIKFLAPGEEGFILGTDSIGRDLWSYIWNGTRFSLMLGLFAATVDFLVGAVMGILMGYFKKFDIIMQAIIKVVINVPSLLLLIMATLIFKPTFWTIAIALTITGWIGMSLVVRSQVLRAKNLQWVTASTFLGTPKRKILMNFLPVVLPLVITQIVLTVSGVILAETSLSFIGLGVPNQPSLGSAISAGGEIVLSFPRYVFIPATVLLALSLSLQLIATEIERSIVRKR